MHLIVCENSLDACESINELPDIRISIEEFTQAEFNVLRGLHKGGGTKKKAGAADDGIIDAELFQKKSSSSNKRNSSIGGDTANNNNNSNNNNTAEEEGKTKHKKKAAQEGYFRIKVRDNGCGMRHEDIPNLLGRVLSGSKYGVRQTRGKFGLGAKMALIW
jgi:DNA topoisomerase VI subunit B